MEKLTFRQNQKKSSLFEDFICVGLGFIFCGILSIILYVAFPNKETQYIKEPPIIRYEKIICIDDDCEIIEYNNSQQPVDVEHGYKLRNY